MSCGVVNYSSSDSEDIDTLDLQGQQHNKNKSTKRKHEESKKLPVPDSIQNMFKQQKRLEDPLKYDGRIRSFEHVEGNWATFVYIAYKTDERFLVLLEEVVKCLRPFNFQTMADFHLSLSRTVTIRHHWIESLTQSLQKAFQNKTRFLCGLTSFKLYTNDEKTRTFLSLQVSDCRDKLKELTKLVDSCFEDFHLEKYYKNPSYHISIAWCLGDVINQLSDQQYTILQDKISSFIEDNEDLNYIDVNQVMCKTGNKIFSFHLIDS